MKGRIYLPLWTGEQSERVRYLQQILSAGIRLLRQDRLTNFQDTWPN